MDHPSDKSITHPYQLTTSVSRYRPNRQLMTTPVRDQEVKTIKNVTEEKLSHLLYINNIVTNNLTYSHFSICGPA